MAASFQVNQPTKFTTTDVFSEILRGINTLSIQSNGAEDVPVPHHILASMESQEPPAQLNQTKRGERVAQRPHPIGIPNVPDDEDSPRRQRRERRAAAIAGPIPCESYSELIIKAPIGAVPVGQDTRKMMRGLLECFPECEQETSEAILRDIDEMDNQDRQLSSPSANSGASSSPATSDRLVPTPPFAEAGGDVASVTAAPKAQPRRRGRPPKPRPDGETAAAQQRAPPMTANRSAGSAGGRGQLQPRPTPPAGVKCGSTVVGGLGVVDFLSTIFLTFFLSATELAEATKEINRYREDELASLNEKGELLTHTFAKEGNWAKLVALNSRWLNNTSLGDIFTNINTASSMGHTPILEAVLQQNLKAVEYCCLFTSSSDVNLYRGLVESALLPSDAIFSTILRAMCHEIDENGNPIKRSNRFIDQPIHGWSFRNQELGNYAGLTLAQMLTLRPADTHPRLATLIDFGANPRREIDSSADEKYRPYIDCVCLAAAFSPAPFECLRALGMNPDADRPFPWDDNAATNWWRLNTICRRVDLSPSYRECVRQKLDGMPLLSVDEVDTELNGLNVLNQWYAYSA